MVNMGKKPACSQEAERSLSSLTFCMPPLSTDFAPTPSRLLSSQRCPSSAEWSLMLRNLPAGPGCCIVNASRRPLRPGQGRVTSDPC